MSPAATVSPGLTLTSFTTPGNGATSDPAAFRRWAAENRGNLHERRRTQRTVHVIRFAHAMHVVRPRDAGNGHSDSIGFGLVDRRIRLRAWPSIRNRKLAALESVFDDDFTAFSTKAGRCHLRRIVAPAGGRAGQALSPRAAAQPGPPAPRPRRAIARHAHRPAAPPSRRPGRCGRENACRSGRRKNSGCFSMRTSNSRLVRQAVDLRTRSAWLSRRAASCRVGAWTITLASIES